MKLHKENTAGYEPFYKFVRDYEIDEQGSNQAINELNNSGHNYFEKQSHLLQVLLNFQKEIETLTYPEKISLLLNKSVKRIIPIKESAILVIDENDHHLKPYSKVESGEIISRMNHYREEGILNIIFDSHKVIIIPELNTVNQDGPKLNYLIFPFYEENKRKGIFVLLTPLDNEKIMMLDEEIISIILRLALSKIDSIMYKRKLNTTIEELQTYQAKLSNDFRLAAIGELTDGIVEDIMSPLQVITSYVDILSQEDEANYELKKIKKQVTKIITSINRLVKFSNLNQKSIKIQPCNVNDVINDYYNLVKSTIESINLELVLDFEKNIPPILSHSSYLYQLLTNVIGMIKTQIKGDGGIILQTRYHDDNIIIKLISTAKLKSYSNELAVKNGKGIDLNTRIVENLMKKHEGYFKVDSQKESGSTIWLYFPLKRKIRV